MHSTLALQHFDQMDYKRMQNRRKTTKMSLATSCAVLDVQDSVFGVAISLRFSFVDKKIDWIVRLQQNLHHKLRF